MKVRMDELIQAVATALEIVEIKLLGASENHGKRIAVLCSMMGKELRLSEDEIKVITTCALFHDNALTEYILSERASGKEKAINLKLHCIYGQRNIESLLFGTASSYEKDLILFHHEQADGGGPFGKKEGEFPLGAELIAIADMVDVNYQLQNVSGEKLSSLKEEIAAQSGKQYTKTATDAMLAILDQDVLVSLRDENINETTGNSIPHWEVDINDEALIRIADLSAKVIDYTSAFTRRHSVQTAEIVGIMCRYYEFDPTLRTKAYLAASLHDIGKLATPTEILEKSGKLDEHEYYIIRDHARVTYELLKGVTGFEEICIWASDHHEKLDGSGYHFGKKANELDFVSRLIACADMYQAIGEVRPYHPARDHEETMEIIMDLANRGLIDRKIATDLDVVLAQNSVQPFCQSNQNAFTQNTLQLLHSLC